MRRLWKTSSRDRLNGERLKKALTQPDIGWYRSGFHQWFQPIRLAERRGPTKKREIHWIGGKRLVKLWRAQEGRAWFFWSNEFRNERKSDTFSFEQRGWTKGMNPAWLNYISENDKMDFYILMRKKQKKVSGQQLSSLEIRLGSHRIQVWDLLPLSTTYSHSKVV